jgi:hypothetical protein
MSNVRKWGLTAAENASVAGGANTISFAEGQSPGSVNNSAREMMAQLRTIYEPDEWGWVEHSATASVASQTVFKIAGDQTSDWTANRRWRLKSGSSTRYGYVVSSSYTAETTITVAVDSGSLSASHSLAALAAIDTNHIPAGTYVTSASAAASYEALGLVRDVSTETGTTYEFVATDAGKIKEFNNAASTLVTIPSSASVGLAVKTRIDVVQYGAGTVSFTAGAGVTLRSYSSHKALQGQYAGATLYKRAADEWVLLGNIKA